MAMLPSPLGPQAGLQMLGQQLQRQVSEGRSLTVTDQLVSSFLWSINISKSYMSQGSPSPLKTAMHESAVGLLANLKT